MLSQLIYWLKCKMHRLPRVYGVLYHVATFNLDYLKLRLSRVDYPSKFGGLWTDRQDFPEQLASKLRAGQLNDDEARRLASFSKQGYLILPGAVPSAMIDAYLADLDSLRMQDDTPLKVTSFELEQPIQYNSEVHARYKSIRTVDDYFYLPGARALLFNQTIERYLHLLLDTDPVLTQSLNFLHGSQQGMHKDTAFVVMNSPIKFLGVWIALEDVTAGSGELIYFPGSHRWQDYLFSGHFKHYDKMRDGPQSLDDNYLWLYREAERRGIREAHFLAKKGDVLIWHADLAHGGASVIDASATRRSLVGHFCSRGVKPLYCYYKPAQRKTYTDGKWRYMSSYYRHW
jgi:hypothetical protein